MQLLVFTLTNSTTLFPHTLKRARSSEQNMRLDLPSNRAIASWRSRAASFHADSYRLLVPLSTPELNIKAK